MSRYKWYQDIIGTKVQKREYFKILNDTRSSFKYYVVFWWEKDVCEFPPNYHYRYMVLKFPKLLIHANLTHWFCILGKYKWRASETYACHMGRRCRFNRDQPDPKEEATTAPHHGGGHQCSGGPAATTRHR